MDEQQKKLILSKLNGMKTEELNAIVTALEPLALKNLLPHDIFPVGIIIKDSAEAKFILDPIKHQELMDIINATPNQPIYRKLTVFPLGIIKQDLYETKLQLGGNGQ
ncbi:MAG: hypothetical protein ACOYXT_00865 [Bacteroidota bacterium]